MTLYRKYRPNNFDEIFEQQHVKITLQNEIKDQKIAHAYLFCGPRAVGKTTISRIFSKAINCLNRKESEANPCNECEMCVSLNAGNNLDVIEIDAASHTGVDNVRENIIEVSKIAPSSAKYRVFVIDEVHMLSLSAFNALLKLLEEPPQNVVFILCTTEVHKIPATIISRCQRFDFKKISFVEVVKKLELICKKENIEVPKKVLESVARHSEGHLRDAESLLGQILSISDEKVTVEDADLIIPRSDFNEALELVRLLSKKDVVKSITLINKLIDEGIDLKTFIKDLIELLRKMMLLSVNPGLSEKFSLELGGEIEIEINKVIAGTQTNQIINIIDKMILVQNEIKNSFIVQLPLEIAITELCMTRATVNIAPVPPVSQQAPPPQPTNTAQSTQTLPPANTQQNINYEPKDVSLEQVQQRWSSVLAKVKQENHSLSFILQACEPSDIKEGDIKLTFRYKFHRDRMEEQEVKGLVEKVMTSIFQSTINIQTELDTNNEGVEKKDSSPQKQGSSESNEKIAKKESPKKVDENVDIISDNDDDMINNLLKTFGGKVVN